MLSNTFQTREHILQGESKYNINRGGYDLYKPGHIAVLFLQEGGRMVIQYYSGSKCVQMIISARQFV